ncbi:endopeptidase [Clostridium sp.]|uniref:endopeptidase n=1 Tax=Clostridium sp. TaxID=1506 RepID=UPI001A5E5375|nr:endopeptidase [Clostridium sp.]MBK5234317.1 endopeptidase [Clostridium sp.]
MGNYNTQYQSYYNNLGKKQRVMNNFGSEKNRQSRISNFYTKRLTRELIGVLALFIFILFCKVVVTTNTQYVYDHSKEIINKQYDYTTLIEKAKNFKLTDIEVITGSFIEKVKSTISSGDEINSEKIDFQKF